MRLRAWKIGDKHPRAPWTKDGRIIRCPVCGRMSRQGLGAKSVKLYRWRLYAYCPWHWRKLERLGLTSALPEAQMQKVKWRAARRVGIDYFDATETKSTRWIRLW